MVDGGVVRLVVPHHKGIVQIRHVRDVRPGPVAKPLFIQLVVEVHHGVVFVQPALVGVRRLGVRERRHELHVHFVCDVHDGHPRAAIEAKGQLLPLVVCIRALVRDHLGIVGVGSFVCPSRHRGCWIAHVDGVKAACSRVGPYAVSVPCGLVHGDVVGVAKSQVLGHRGQLHGSVGHVEHLRQIDDLNAMACGLADHEGMVVEHLDVSPEALHRGRGYLSQKRGVDRVSDLHNGQSVGPPKKQEFPVRRRIHPTPAIVAVGPAAKGIQRPCRQQIQPFARVFPGQPSFARNLSKGKQGIQKQGAGDQGLFHGGELGMQRNNKVPRLAVARRGTNPFMGGFS